PVAGRAVHGGTARPAAGEAGGPRLGAAARTRFATVEQADPVRPGVRGTGVVVVRRGDRLADHPDGPARRRRLRRRPAVGSRRSGRGGGVTNEGEIGSTIRGAYVQLRA